MYDKANEEVDRKQLDLAKRMLISATKNPRLSKYISEDMIEEIISKVYIAKSVDDYMQKVREQYAKAKNQNEEEIEEYEMNEETDMSSRGMCFEEVILINYRENKENIYQTIIHEIVHYLSVKDKENGILQLGKELAEENSDWEGVKAAMIESLNESITQYITRMILGKNIKMETSYDYGVDVLEAYTKATNGYEEEQNNILEAYFNKDKEALKHISSDFNLEGDRMWQDMLKSFLVYDVAMSENKFYLLKHCISNEAIKKHMKKISTKYATRTSNKKLDDEKTVITEKYEKIYNEEPVMNRDEFFRQMRKYFNERDNGELYK